MCLQKARTFLKEGGHTCVFIINGEIFTSNERGIKPLLNVLNSDMDTLNAVVADKVVGKAAAFLYELMQIKILYAQTVSEPALSVLKRAGINVEYDTLVSSIRNREKTGRCPMESAVWEIDNAQEARKILENKIKGETV